MQHRPDRPDRRHRHQTDCATSDAAVRDAATKLARGLLDVIEGRVFDHEHVRKELNARPTTARLTDDKSQPILFVMDKYQRQILRPYAELTDKALDAFCARWRTDIFAEDAVTALSHLRQLNLDDIKDTYCRDLISYALRWYETELLHEASSMTMLSDFCGKYADACLHAANWRRESADLTHKAAVRLRQAWREADELAAKK